MILSRRAALGGVQLDSVDDTIVIQGIEEAAGRDAISDLCGEKRYDHKASDRRYRGSIFSQYRFQSEHGVIHAFLFCTAIEKF